MKSYVAAFLMVLSLSARTMAGERFVWPELPTPEEIQKAMQQTTYSGLVILQKDCKLDYTARRSGVVRDSFTRYLIVNDEGIGRAKIDVKAETGSKIEKVEARTVAPDGAVTVADSAKDTHIVEVKRFDQNEVLADLAFVVFPAPTAGAILDLHVVSYSENHPSYHQEALTEAGTPSLETRYSVRPAYYWSIMLLNGASWGGKLAKGDSDWVDIKLGPVPAKKSEPHSLPSFRTQVTLVLYHDFTPSDRRIKSSKASRATAYTPDSMGRISDLRWEETPYRDSWMDYLQDEEKSIKEFLKREGAADKISVDAIAPRDLPAEERVRRLYQHAQTRIRFNPDAENIASLGDMLKKGESYPWQGTLFLSYLLERAGIHFRRVVIADRYRISFSPVVTSAHIFNFADAVMVDLPAGPLFMMPGNKSLPFGCLPVSYQYSLAFGLEGEKGIRTFYTPLNAPGVDQVTYRFESTLSPAGELQGSLKYGEKGTPGADFRTLSAYRDFRKQNPDRSMDKVVTDKDWTTLIEKAVDHEVIRFGKKVQFEKLAVTTAPSDSELPVEIGATIRGEGLAQIVQDQWIVHACPLVTGYESPFTDPQRATPIWNQQGARITFEGTIRLPAGVRIKEMPPQEEFTGPGGAKVTLKVEASSEGEAAAIHSMLEFDLPLIVGSDSYRGWQVYMAKIAALADAKCITTLPPVTARIDR